MALYKEKKSKFWQIRFQYNGKQIVRSSKTTNKRDAMKVEHKLRESLFKQDELGEAESITIDKAMDLYVSTFKEGQNGTATAKSSKLFIEEHIDTSRNLETLSTSDVEKLKNIRLRNGNKQSTILKMNNNFISSFHKNARKLGYKVQEIEYPSLTAEKNKLRYLSVDEEQALLNELRPTGRFSPVVQSMRQDNYDLVVMLLDTGARHNEIVTLTWDDVDMYNRTIKLYRPKVRNESVLFITDRLYSILTRRKKSRLNEYIFNNKKGEHRAHCPISIKKAIKRAGLKNVSIHTFRHTAASRWIQNGMSLYEVSQMLGHTTIQMTMRYAHLEQTDISKKACDLLNNIHQQSTPQLKVV